MKNFVQRGDTITLVAPYAVLSGGGLKVGNFFGVANADAAQGAAVEADVEGGVYDLTALGTDTFAAGDYVYWDDANKRCTSTASGNSKIGGATAAKAGGITVVRVRLNGTTL